MKRPTFLTFFTASPEQTKRFGETLGSRIRSGLCISLVGPLGSGKTIVTGGICRGLGVAETVLSPTFVMYEEFTGRLPVVHIDLYRLEHESEIEELGVFDLAGEDTVLLAEWGDRSERLFAQSDVVLQMKYLSESRRELKVSYGPSAADLFEDQASWLF